MKRSQLDPNLYINIDIDVVLLLYNDDLIVIDKETKMIEELKDELHKVFAQIWAYLILLFVF
jgi:hypothetical protein